MSGASSHAQQVVPRTAASVPAPDTSLEPQVVTLSLNKAQLIDLPLPARDVVIATPGIADIIVKTPRQAYMVGKAFGETNVFFVGNDGNVILHLAVRVEPELKSALKSIHSYLPKTSIKLEGVNGSVVISGTAPTPKDASDALGILKRFIPEGTEIINMVRISGDTQVMLQVKIAEMERSITKKLGFNTTLDGNILGEPFNMTSTVSPATVISGAVGINTLGIGAPTFNTLETHGLLKTLSEPTLIATSGETANFLAGGEYPTVSGIATDSGTPTYTLKTFGVALSFTPVVMANNQINIRIQTEVSRVSAENQLTLGDGTVISGTANRRASSTVMLASGGSLMIAGLLEDKDVTTMTGAPWIKNLPILGALFRSHDFINNRTELVIMVTAYLIRPPKKGRQLALPTDGFVSPADSDLYLLGRLHKQYGKGENFDSFPNFLGPIGYMME
ncbi:MAG: type II and III secretion system protein family protein [Rhodospirillales bacterium]|nr:type II and III secretion system protein family protein [Rhodospirillales bacterium]